MKRRRLESMNRLTERFNNGQAAVMGCGENCKYDYKYCRNHYEECPEINKIYERLAEYEDTGLTPAEIMELKERDKPKLVVYEHEFEDNRLISYVQRCESCGEQYDPSEKFNFCPNCGQRILRRKED